MKYNANSKSEAMNHEFREEMCGKGIRERKRQGRILNTEKEQ